MPGLRSKLRWSARSLPPAYQLAPALVVAAMLLVARWLSWPAFTTHDSIHVTREAMSGAYTTYHPLLNALLLRVFAVPFDSYAPYTTLQMVLCCTLMLRAASLVSAASNARWLTLASVLIWALSIHTVLYLGIVWKDVLTAYSLAMIAAVVFHVRTSPLQALSRLDAVLFGVSVFLAVTMRHGMAFNLLLVPIFIGLGRTRREVRLRTPLAFAFVGFVLISLLSRSSVVHNDPTHMLRIQISTVSHPFLAMVSNPNGYTSDDYAGDAALATRVFGPEYKQRYTPDYARNDVTLTDHAELERSYRAILERTMRLCPLNVSQCLSDRVQMMLSTLQPSTRPFGMTFYDLGIMKDCPKVYGMTPEACEVLERFESSEKPSSSVRALEWVTRTFIHKRRTLTNLYAWNLIPALGLLLLVLALSSPRSPLWIATAFVGAQCVLPFAASGANDFRYYYFLAVFFAVFVPIAAVRAFSTLRRRD